MSGGATDGCEVVIETERLLLRPWRVGEAAIQREMWNERDPRVPPHRRIDAYGHPTVADFEGAIRAPRPSAGGLLAVEPKDMGAAVGYCGLIASGRGAWASVWDWNTDSRRVLAKVGFTEVGREETVHGTNLVPTRML